MKHTGVKMGQTFMGICAQIKWSTINDQDGGGNNPGK